MVERNASRGAAVGGAHSVRAFVVQAVVQRFADNAPLHREIAAMSKVMRAVNGPTERAVIDDDPIDVFRVEGIIAAFGSFWLVLVAKTEAQIAHDHIRGVLDLESVVPERDAIPGSGLAGDRDVGLV